MADFFDLKHFPKEEGLIMYGVSMNRIGNRQSPERSFEDFRYMVDHIQQTEGIGGVILYSDYLYFHSDQPANLLRDRYKSLMLSHKNGLMNLIIKQGWLIKKAFSFYTIGQLIIDNSEIFETTLKAVIALYQDDVVFKAYVEADALESGHFIGSNERMFILEEIVIFYLAAKGKLRFNNQFVQGTEKWVLSVYPGTPLKSETYLFQKNPLKLSWPGSRFESGCYDIEGKKFYEYTKLDLAAL
jgi:hypothetical protein